MSHLPPSAVRPLTCLLACLLAVTAWVAGAALLPAPAHATSPGSAPSTAPDTASSSARPDTFSGMMPPDAPDAPKVPTAGSGTAAGISAGAPTGQWGVDTSHWQHDASSSGTIDWVAVAASGRRFAVVKATDNGYTDPYVRSDLAAAHAAGLVVGAYAYARPASSAIAQADAFANAIGTLPPGSLPPVLDLEDKYSGLSVPDLVAWTQTFLTRLAADTHTTPMIYSGPSFWSQYMGGSTAFTGYPLWEAHYTTAPAPAAMGGWPTYTMWQFTDGTYAVPSSGPYVPGITGLVDQDVFNTSNGATPSNLHAPVGSFDAATVTPTGTLTATGWALDPDTPAAASTVAVYVDGNGQNVLANGSRPDVGATYPAAGSLHGFSATVQGLTPGGHTVCAHAIDTSNSDQHTTLDCKTVKVVPGLPLGSLDTVSVDRTGVLTATGWAFDPDTPSTASTVAVYVDGNGQNVLANGSRPDVGNVFPSAGSQHGYTATAQLTPGNHTVCSYGIDSTFSSVHSNLGCRPVTFSPQLPLGSFDSAEADGTGTLTMEGWAFDPDAPTAPVSVTVVVDGSYSQTVTADGSRPDVGAAFPTAGSQHGFTATATATPGGHTVCAYANDTTYSDLHTIVDCRSVTVSPRLPFGTVDTTTVDGSGHLTVAGWAIDPDTPSAAVPVHVYVDGQGQAVTANGPRPDVGAAFSGAGNSHGYTAGSQLTVGPHSVCVYGIDTSFPDRHSTLGCRTVTR